MGALSTPLLPRSARRPPPLGGYRRRCLRTAFLKLTPRPPLEGGGLGFRVFYLLSLPPRLKQGVGTAQQILTSNSQPATPSLSSLFRLSLRPLLSLSLPNDHSINP